jgi:hypothetical protein
MATRYVALQSALLVSGQAYGQSVCFLDHLEKHGDGIIAHFQKDRYVTFMPVSGPRRGFYTSDEPKPYIEEGSVFATAIPASVGDTFSMIINPHAACTLKIAVRHGKIGVVERAPDEVAFMASGGTSPPRDFEEFFPARWF